MMPYSTGMQYQYYLLNELIKSYHVVSVFDARKAAAILEKINAYRLQIAMQAEQRQWFVEQLEVVANASGYTNDIFFTHDDIDSLVIRMIARLDTGTTVSLVQQGTRENLFTRQPVAWQQLMSDVQIAPDTGQQIPFDFPQEIYLEKSQTLDIGVTDQTTAGFVFVHGCNLKDDAAPNQRELVKEIGQRELNGKPNLPKPQLVPIQFKFTANTLNNPAVAVNGGDAIYSIKSERSVILTEVSTTSINSRITLIDKGRDQEMCNEVESAGVAGFFTNPFSNWYPLPYPQLLRSQDRIQLRALNGSIISGVRDVADVTQTLCFRGFTI